MNSMDIKRNTLSHRFIRYFLTMILSVSIILPGDRAYGELEAPKLTTASILLLGLTTGYIAWNIFTYFFQGEKVKKIPEVDEALLIIKMIATNQELKTLRSLRTPEEVEQFMNAFWKRRDPTPDTSVNEFKIVHMRRVRYANENFTTGLKAGALTDQGRVYILYGEPYTIERFDFTDSGGNFLNRNTIDSYPAEIWYYNFPSMRNSLPTIFSNFSSGETVFIFIDLQKIGEYTQVYSNKAGEYIDSRVYK